MKLRIQAAALNEGISVVKIVNPSPVTAQGGAGYLFVVREGRLAVYTRDGLHQMRVDLPGEADGDGMFIFPAEKIGAIEYLDGPIEIEADYNKDDDRYWVRYSTPGGAEQEFSTYDPRLMGRLDEALEKAGSEVVFSAAVLREGISTARNFLAPPNDSRVEEHFQTLQLFDTSKDEWKKGDGHLYASDGVRICYFFCEAFQGKGLAIHGQHLRFLNAFLSKCEGDIKVKTGEGVSFAINSKGQVFGWSHHVKEHRKFSYYAPAQDKFVLRAPKDILVRAIRFVRAGYDSKQDRIRVVYDHEDKTLRFMASEGSGKISSHPVGVKPITEDDGGGEHSSTKSFAFNANINQLLELIEPMKANEADFRVAVIPASGERKEAGLFRTIEAFWLDSDGKLLISPNDSEQAVLCKVTRFMPSRV